MPLNKAVASLEAHFIQINLFPRLKLESAIRAERIVTIGELAPLRLQARLDLALDVGVKQWISRIPQLSG